MAYEIEEALRLVRPSLVALRQGVASEWQWSTVGSAIEVALAIEDQRVVKGMREHFTSAARALDEISKRAMVTGAWCHVELHLQELDDIAEAIRLHEFQLEHLCADELARATATAKIRVIQARKFVGELL